MDCSIESDIIVGSMPLTNKSIDMYIYYSGFEPPHYVFICVDTKHNRPERGALVGISASPSADAALTTAGHTLWFLHQAETATWISETESTLVFDYLGIRRVLCILMEKVDCDGQYEVLFGQVPDRHSLIAVGRGIDRKSAITHAKTNVLFLWWD